MTMPAPVNGFEPRIGRSVSLDHAAELLGVSRRTIYNRIREGRLQTIRTIGGSQRVLVDSMSETREHDVNALRSDNPGAAVARRSSF
jgi:excisionase family DNA binding protein